MSTTQATTVTPSPAPSSIWSAPTILQEAENHEQSQEVGEVDREIPPMTTTRDQNAPDVIDLTLSDDTDDDNNESAQIKENAADQDREDDDAVDVILSSTEDDDAAEVIPAIGEKNDLITSNVNGNQVRGEPYLLSTGTSSEEAGDFYYLAFQQLWLCKPSKDSSEGMYAVCRHCLCAARHSTVEIFSNNFSHSIQHLLNKCNSLPTGVRRKLESLKSTRKVPQPPGQRRSLAYFFEPAWKKPTAVLIKGFPVRKKQKKNTQKQNNISPTPSESNRRRQRETGETNEIDHASCNNKRPRRKLNGDNKDWRYTPGAASSPAKSTSNKVPIAASAHPENDENDSYDGTWSRVESKLRAVSSDRHNCCDDDDDDATWSFVDNGSHPVGQVYKTVARFGEEYAKEVFIQKDKKSNWYRVGKLVREIDRLVGRELCLEDVLDAIHVLQGTKSFYTVSDELKDLTRSDIENLLQQKQAAVNSISTRNRARTVQDAKEEVEEEYGRENSLEPRRGCSKGQEDALKKQIQELRKTLRACTRELAKVKREKSVAESLVADARQELKAVRDELSEEKRTSERAVSVSKQETQRFKEQLKKAREKAAELDKQNKSLARARSGSDDSQTLTGLRAEIKTLKLNNRQLAKERGDAQQENSELRVIQQYLQERYETAIKHRSQTG